jgi:two-component system chemotaxis response regulator CheB
MNWNPVDNADSRARIAGPVRTLVVDDSAQARQAMSLLLESFPGIEVVGTAQEGAEALEKVAALRPDLVLMDVQMPVMNGLEAAKRLRQQQVPAAIIMVTLHESAEMEDRCRQMGADAFVPKSLLVSRLSSEISLLFGNRLKASH